MGPFALMHGAIDGVRELPGVRHLRRAAFERQFASIGPAHMFRGVYDSYEAALASAPPVRPLGYDNPASASMYVDRLHVDEYDHPSMFWLLKSFAEGMTSVADLGGSVGIKYFAFGEFITYPPKLVWRVIDVPAVVARGRDFARSKGAGAALEFSDQFADAAGMDVLYTSGALQYLPQSLPEMLERLPRKPKRIIVNTTPIHADKSYFTLNNIGTAYCPYRVQAHQAFVEGVKAHGYELRAEWRNIGKLLPLRFEPGFGLNHYSGFCFDARPPKSR